MVLNYIPMLSDFNKISNPSSATMPDTQRASHIRLHDKEKYALEYTNPVQHWNVGIIEKFVKETNCQIWSDLVKV